VNVVLKVALHCGFQGNLHNQDIRVKVIIMAMEAEITPAARASQVRIQLKSRSNDIQLPQETGPILVSTGEFGLLLTSIMGTC
jgi:hypothetical protein